MGDLTKKQKKLIKELNTICHSLGIDYQNIEDYKKEDRTYNLEFAKDHIIRSVVVKNYTLIDEHLNLLLCDYFFGKKKSFIQLWKTQKFKNFNYYILEKLYISNKLEFAQAICVIPGDIVSDIYKINDLRNGLVHSFFPENLRRNKPIYKGKDIFTLDGLKLFIDDMNKINEFFFKKHKIRKRGT